MESFRLNAELLDVVIDLFGEDNLHQIECELDFIQRIQDFREKFYTKVIKEEFIILFYHKLALI